MRFDLTGLGAGVQLTLRDPRAMARHLISLDLPSATVWQALALMAVASALVSSLALRLAPLELDPAMQAMFGSPLQTLLVQAAVLLVSAGLIYVVGRGFGGKGRLHDALGLMAWIEFVMLFLQCGQIVLLLIAPPLAEAMGLFTIVLFLWILANFIAELHGFRSTGVVLLGIFGTVLIASLALATLAISVFGLGV